MQIDNSWEVQSSGEIESAACTFKILGEYMVATAGVSHVRISHKCK